MQINGIEISGKVLIVADSYKNFTEYLRFKGENPRNPNFIYCDSERKIRGFSKDGATALYIHAYWRNPEFAKVDYILKAIGITIIEDLSW